MKSKTSAGLIIVVTFLMGAIAGAAGFYIYDTKVAAAKAKPAARSTPHDIVGEMSRALELDADQKGKLKVIFDQGRERFRALSKQYAPQSDAIRNETRQAIRQILTEEQKAKFEKIVQDVDKRHREHNHKGTP
jgi:uncharacterized membrane protein